MPEFYSPIPSKAIPYFIFSIFILTFLIPVISILLLKVTNKVSSLEMTNREERVLPFFFIAAFYSVTTYLLNSKMMLPETIFVLMMVVSVLVSVIFLISLKFKISVHSAGIWGTAGTFSGLAIRYLDSSLVIPLLLLYLVAGLTTSSRLYLGRHTPLESWTGAIIGLMICFVGVALFG